MLLVQNDGVIALVAVVGFGDQLGTDGDLGSEADDPGADLISDKVGDHEVNVAWISGMEGAEDEQDFPSSVGRRMEEACPGHLERVFQAWLAAGFLLPEFVEGGDVVVWVPRHVGDSHSETVTHTNDPELGDGILFEKFSHELGSVADSQEVAGWPKVFLQHGDGEVED